MKNVLASLVVVSMMGVGLIGCLASSADEEPIAEDGEALTGFTPTPVTLGDCEYVGGYMVCSGVRGGTGGYTPTYSTCDGVEGELCVAPSHCKQVSGTNALECTTGPNSCYYCKGDLVTDNGQQYASCTEASVHQCPSVGPKAY
ncbi:MAG: hypothetical protein QM820_58275 [Minicystis sp.]